MGVARARAGSMGTLLTLRDTESVMQLGQELEVSRRLAAIGRLTAGVGHEVKNPINAMVVHLELLRGKLAGGSTENGEGSCSGGRNGMWIFCRARCSGWTGWCRRWRTFRVRWSCICMSRICGRWCAQ